MYKSIVVVILVFIIAVTIFDSALAQNPCDEIGSDCRPMTAAEIKAFKERMLAMKELLPIPDAARYETDDASEASIIPFVAETRIPQAVPVCRSWPAGCFAENPYNTISFGFLKKEDKSAPKPKDLLSASQAIATQFENRIEVSVSLLPHPYYPDEIMDYEPVIIEKSITYLSWKSGEENINLHMIFGPRTNNEEETLLLEKPAKNFAPVKSIELILTGPDAEISVLSKKINRKSIEALLGTVVK